MEKIDLKKTIDAYQAKVGEFRVLEVPPQQYLMIDGHGDPNTSASYADALAEIFTGLCKADRDQLIPDSKKQFAPSHLNADTTVQCYFSCEAVQIIG